MILAKPKDFLFVTKIIFVFIFFMVCNNGFCEAKSKIRIGYFHGGRCLLFYRAFINNYFDKEELEVELFGKLNNGQKLIKMPNEHQMFTTVTLKTIRMTGLEIIDEIMKGNLDGGTVGESSFLVSIGKGLPIIAVASLGYTSKNKPCKAIILRNGVEIRNPEDFRGKLFATRRSGPGDPAFLKEFFIGIGINPERDVIIKENISDNEIYNLFKKGEIDGTLSHLYGSGGSGIETLLSENLGYIYRKMDWMNPEMSHALLVFKREFIKKHPEEIKKIIKAYIQRAEFEEALPDSEKKKSNEWGLAIQKEFQGMDLPIFKSNPIIDIELLKQIQDLLFRYGYIAKRIDVTMHIDNYFVESVIKSLHEHKKE